MLDLAPISTGSDAAEALRRSTELARLTERLGYHRFWVAEHHNLPGIASSSPPVLIAHLAALTSTMRIGSGGLMLPNHAPLVVAEQFATLEALHPGRIDLGIGRAPGTDPATARALRRSPGGLAEAEFPQALIDLFGFLGAGFPEGHPYHGVRAVPGAGHAPAFWLLGSSGYSAQLAGRLGLPFAFAHHFSPANTLPALTLYRQAFQPSPTLSRPYAMVAVAVFCADTDQRARWLAGSARLAMLRLRRGQPSTLPSPQEAATHPYSPHELRAIQALDDAYVMGEPARVLDGLRELLDRTQADELMITSQIHGFEDRTRSYELVASLAGSLSPV